MFRNEKLQLKLQLKFKQQQIIYKYIKLLINILKIYSYILNSVLPELCLQIINYAIYKHKTIY